MKKIILTLTILLLLITPVFVLAVDNYGLDATAGAAKLKTEADLPATAGKVIGTLLSLIGVIFFGLMIYGGFMWMTARGNEEQAKKALDTIIAAVIGLVIILAAYAITNFVFKSVQTTGGGSADCTGKPDATDCGDNSVCEKGQCVAICKYNYADKGDCVATAAACATTGYETVTGYCPGTQICCKDNTLAD